MYKRNTETRSPNHCCRGKALNITNSECVFAVLVIRHVIRMHLIILLSAACPSIPYFSTLSPKRHYFRKNVIEHKMCIDFPYNFCPNIYNSKKNVARYYRKFT
jgi:hypothetical protein